MCVNIPILEDPTFTDLLLSTLHVDERPEEHKRESHAVYCFKQCDVDIFHLIVEYHVHSKLEHQQTREEKFNRDHRLDPEGSIVALAPQNIGQH